MARIYAAIFIYSKALQVDGTQCRFLYGERRRPGGVGNYFTICCHLVYTGPWKENLARGNFKTCPEKKTVSSKCIYTLKHHFSSITSFFLYKMFFIFELEVNKNLFERILKNFDEKFYTPRQEYITGWIKLH